LSTLLNQDLVQILNYC